MFQLKDAAQLALKKMPSAEQEALSQVGNISSSSVLFMYIHINQFSLLVQVNSFYSSCCP